MDGKTIDQLDEALVEVGGIDGLFNAVWDKASGRCRKEDGRAMGAHRSWPGRRRPD